MLLTTEIPGITIRRWSPADKAPLVAYADNRNIWRNLTHSFPSPYTEADAEFWVEFANRESNSLHLCIDAAGVAIGGIGVVVGEGVFAKTGEFGYWLAEPFWGKGIATTAAKAMLHHAETNLSLARLEAAVFSWNPNSMRVLEKIGFKREAVLRRSVFKDGLLADRVMYAYLIDA